MQTIESTFRDRSSWPRGQWDNEPDKVQWEDQTTGLPCLAVRNDMGAWCGYVGVAEDHPFFHHYYDQHYSLEVHGGLTFSDFCAEADKEHGICHIPGPGEPDRIWWFGFDCAHCSDVIPRYLAMGWRHDAEAQYRTLDYIKGECASLAKQLKDAIMKDGLNKKFLS